MSRRGNGIGSSLHLLLVPIAAEPLADAEDLRLDILSVKDLETRPNLTSSKGPDQIGSILSIGQGNVVGEVVQMNIEPLGLGSNVLVGRLELKFVEVRGRGLDRGVIGLDGVLDLWT